MKTLDFIAQKYAIDLTAKNPIDLNIGRADLAKLFFELEFKIGAEIGVERGYFSEILCLSNPNLKLICVDPWLAYKGYREHVSQVKLNEIRKEALVRLSAYNTNIIQAPSTEASKLIPEASLDFVYIDGNHSAEHTLADLKNWIPKIKTGGIVAGHDFVRYRGKYGEYNKVKDVVSNYVLGHHIAPLFALRYPNEHTSWMFVKN